MPNVFAFSALWLALVFPAQAQTVTTRAALLLDGVWSIDTQPMPSGASTDDYLASGMRVRLDIAGPTRRALEDHLKDELAGTLELRAPLSSHLCASAFARSVCRSGQIIEPERSRSFEAVFVWFTMSSRDLSLPTNFFFSEQGARAGTRFVNIQIREVDLEWSLWVRSKAELVAQVVAEGPQRKLTSLGQHWRKDGATTPRIKSGNDQGRVSSH